MYRCWEVTVILGLAAGAGLWCEAKPIHLRTDPFDPSTNRSPELTAAAGVPGQEPRLHGLYLVQLKQAPRAEWRAALEQLGLRILRYVPEDAFVVRCAQVPAGEVRNLPFIEWIGPYLARHKLHPALAAATAPSVVETTVLLAPDVDASTVASLRQRFQLLIQENRLRSGVVLRGRVPASELPNLTASEAVLWVEPAPRMRLYDEVSSKIVAGDGGPGRLQTQQLGWDGSGVTVAVADSGLALGEAATMHPDLWGRTPAFFYYGSLSDAADEHGHGTHVTGIIAGDGATGETDENGQLYGLGVAPGARIVTQRIFDGLGLYQPPPSFERLTRDAVRAGAVIGSNSWGDDTGGRYDVSAMEFDELVRDADALRLGDQPYILEFSAGNAGPGARTIGSPAVAKNVIATGACQNDRFDLFLYDSGADAMADFSSRGPCEDGRIKPDLVAPGTWIASLASAAAPDENAWLPISQHYVYMGGTSQAGPHVSGAATLFVQYYRHHFSNATPSPALVKAALINSADDMDDSLGTAPVPNFDEGWGRLNVARLLGGEREFRFFDQSVPLTTDQTWEQVVPVDGSEPLRVTMAYTDVPGAPFVLPALVNDLDLEVIDPRGVRFLGNAFHQGESVPNPPAADRRNNVECVYLEHPVPGPYTIRVRAHRVPEDARRDTPEVDQDFALVISGRFIPPGVASMQLDRTAYTAPGRIHIRIFDSDRAGAPRLTAQVESSTEAQGEIVPLVPADAHGSFTGHVATVTGPATADGQLQIRHGDVITVRYLDESEGHIRLVTASADLVAPRIGSVQSQVNFGVVTIHWTTDEPVRGGVRYGTNQPLTLQAAADEWSTEPRISLGALPAGTTWYYQVEATDEAGNVAVENNGGQLFTVVIPPTPPVLLVDGYDDPFFGAPPLEGYTEALAQAGAEYEVWHVTEQGDPPLAALQAHRAVIWRVGEFTGWSPAQGLLISNYLAAGGALFVASMDLLTRNVETFGPAFNRDVLQVDAFEEDVTVPSIVGLGDPVGEDLEVDLDYSVYEELWFGFIGDISDTFSPTPEAVPVLGDGFGGVVGLRWPRNPAPGQGRLVFCSFPLDAVPLENGQNDRVQLMRNVLRFLAPGAEGEASLRLDRTAYTLPALVGLELGDPDQRGQGRLSVQVSTETDPGGQELWLEETVTPGVFRGELALIPVTDPAGPGRLRARHGDLLQVRYQDTSIGREVVATAQVDTQPPAVFDTRHEPEYVQATVSWETDEPADALVQFGESPLLGRTAYDPIPSTRHDVTLTGLRPDTVYYYRVVSRDAAGNLGTDDNRGNLYTFRTLAPLLPPFVDDMNGTNTAWTVYSSDESVSGWERGRPDNGHETQAHSPPWAWGTSLRGQAYDYMETFLISPSIYLGGGNTATLTFWHSYDFIPRDELDIWESGTVYIITNGVGTPIAVAQYGFEAENWTRVEVDLTPFVGHMINVVFAYQMLSFAFDAIPRPGWLVDDVSITVHQVDPGVLVFSNNLHQAEWVLSGPVARRMRGAYAVLSNAPPGQYIVEYADLPWHLTPAPQTNTLVSGQTLVLEGRYTFLDTNANGLPDDYEMAYFGGPDPERGTGSDADRDGMSDWAEFVAGTNPTNAASALALRADLLPGTDGLRLTWNAVPGRAYRLWGRTDATPWEPLGDWIRASSSILRYTLPASRTGAAWFYRVEVAP
ncbi:MAG: S8 family serine peptidase [Limisphaera sp.]